MKGICVLIACAALIGGGATGAALAADTVQPAPVEDYYAQLQQGLDEQVGVLAGVRDKATADAACPALRKNLSQLEGLAGKAQPAELWRYIDNTPDAKQKLVERVQRLSLQLQRLEKAECYGSEGLGALLAPLFSSAAASREAP